MSNKKDSIAAYFDFVHERPDLFVQSEYIELVLDEQKMREFSISANKPMGLVYNNFPFWAVVADLCIKKTGELYSYARVVYPNPESNGVVAIPYYNGHFGLISIFRHAPRLETGGEFPRGFADTKGLTIEENLRKELSEELNVDEKAECSITFLGDVRADSGLSSGKAQVYLVEFVSSDGIIPTNEEGIHGFEWVSESDMKQRIRSNLITDGFTLSAYAKFITMHN